MVIRGAPSSTACLPKPDRQLVESATDLREGRLDLEPHGWRRPRRHVL
jgi:hypothetical protein